MRKSFTVIEFIMVIVIVAILAALAVNRFHGYDEIKLNLAVDRLVADIRYAQNLAIADHEEVYVAFSTAGDTYEVYNMVGSKTYYANPYSQEDFIVNFTTDKEFKNIDISAANFDGTATLRFSALGEPRDGAGNTLLAQGGVTLSYKGNSGTVTVQPNTGYCSK